MICCAHVSERAARAREHNFARAAWTSRCCFVVAVAVVDVVAAAAVVAVAATSQHFDRASQPTPHDSGGRSEVRQGKRALRKLSRAGSAASQSARPRRRSQTGQGQAHCFPPSSRHLRAGRGKALASQQANRRACGGHSRLCAAAAYEPADWLQLLPLASWLLLPLCAYNSGAHATPNYEKQRNRTNCYYSQPATVCLPVRYSVWLARACPCVAKFARLSGLVRSFARIKNDNNSTCAQQSLCVVAASRDTQDF